MGGAADVVSVVGTREGFKGKLRGSKLTPDLRRSHLLSELVFIIVHGSSRTLSHRVSVLLLGGVTHQACSVQERHWEELPSK